MSKNYIPQFLHFPLTVLNPFTVSKPITSDTKKKEIRCSRSFGKKVTQYSDLVEAITTFVSRASFKARNQNTISGMITIFVTTNPFDKRVRGYKANIAIPLEPPTNHTTIIIRDTLLIIN